MGRTHDVTISGFDLDRLETAAKFLAKKAAELEEALNEARREIVQLQLELHARTLKPHVFRPHVGWGNPQTLIEQNAPTGVLSNPIPNSTTTNLPTNL